MSNLSNNPSIGAGEASSSLSPVTETDARRFSYVSAPRKYSHPARFAKLKQRVSWPTDLGELAGERTESYGRLAEVFTDLSLRRKTSRQYAFVKAAVPPPEISLPTAEAFDRAVSFALDEAPHAQGPVTPGLALVKSEGEAYLQWIPLDGLEKGIELTVPLAAAAKQITVRVHLAGVPVPGMDVRLQISDSGYVRGTTNNIGQCTLNIPRRGVRAFVPVSVRPSNTYWSVVDGIDVAGAPGPFRLDLEVEPLRPNLEAYLGPVLGPSQNEFGAGVCVGIVDSGWTKHDALPNFKAGVCTVSDDPAPKDIGDTIGHATMIAGIIGGQGDGKTTMRGIAPGVRMIGFRAFARGAIKTNGAAISKGIRRAVDAGCHIINISVGGLEEMPSAKDEIQYAWDRGVVCIVAAGNLSRQDVLFPAKYAPAIAVSAMGRKLAYPELSLFSLCETSDAGTDPAHYLPDFTNIGAEVAFCAPGVGIVSTFLGNSLHSSKGTSFAAPIVSGLLARLLGLPQGIATLQSPPTAKRSEAMKLLLETSPLLFGFKVAGSEGRGFPR